MGQGPDQNGYQGYPFEWYNGTRTPFPASIGGGSASSINDLGQIVGAADLETGSHAFLWDKDEVTDLGTLECMFSCANDINNLGQVVGSSICFNPISHPVYTPFIWQNGTMSALTSLGSRFSEANAINDIGIVVGYSGPDDDTTHACIWQDGNVTDLNDLISADSGWTLGRATDIAGNGMIVGIGQYQGNERAFLLVPVPEPSGYLALTSGLGCLAAAIRRRRF